MMGNVKAKAKSRGQRLGLIVADYLRREGMTQGQFHYKVKLSQPTLSDLVAGKIDHPKHETIEKLAPAMEMTVEELQAQISRRDDKMEPRSLDKAWEAIDLLIAQVHENRELAELALAIARGGRDK